jgi:hypothetical protein
MHKIPRDARAYERRQFFPQDMLAQHGDKTGTVFVRAVNGIKAQIDDGHSACSAIISDGVSNAGFTDGIVAVGEERRIFLRSGGVEPVLGRTAGMNIRVEVGRG